MDSNACDPYAQRMPIQTIITHPGGAHKDDFLACSVMLAKFPIPIVRKDPSDDELDDSIGFGTIIFPVGYALCACF